MTRRTQTQNPKTKPKRRGAPPTTRYPKECHSGASTCLSSQERISSASTINRDIFFNRSIRNHVSGLFSAQTNPNKLPELLIKYLIVPFELITQLVLLGESSICPGSPWMFHEVFSSPSFFFLFSFLEIFLLWKFFCLFPNFIYLALGWKRRSSSSLAFSFFLSQPFDSFLRVSWRYMGF